MIGNVARALASVTVAPAAMLTTGVPSSSVIEKLALPEPLKPPPRLVAEEAVPLMPTVTVSASPSSRMSSSARSVTVALAGAVPPVKVIVGAVPSVV